VTGGFAVGERLAGEDDRQQEPASPPITLDLRNIVYPRAVDLAGEAD
jgi:hypothetical protein